MIDPLFWLALVFIPFTSITGLPFLGESQHELATYFFLPALALSAWPILMRFRVAGTDPVEPVRIYALPKILFIVLALIVLTFLPNVAEIKDSYFQGRNGLNKFLTSSALVMYGFALAFLTYFLSAKKSWDRLIVNPLAISVLLCAFFSFFEMTYRWTGALGGFFSFLSGPIYGNFPILEWDQRLRSVAFEPPDFANTAGYIWPWLLGAVLSSRGGKRWVFLGIWVLLNVMIFLSEARTSLVVIMGLLSVFFVLRFVFLAPRLAPDADKMMAPLAFLLLVAVPFVVACVLYFFDDLVLMVVSGDRMSNLSRLASITAAFRMFRDSPIFGFGFGQYAFHVLDYMPAWGYYSEEVRLWFMESSTYWPSVYSLYGRLAADMGILGLAMWVGIWLWLARAVLVATLVYRKKTGILPFAAYPLILSCFAVLLAGVPCDSLRAPMIWINMGLACRYLFETRKALAAAETPEALTA